MSQTLVAPSVAYDIHSPPPAIRHRHHHHHYTPQQLQQFEASRISSVEAALASTVSHEESRLAAQLSYLSSQHEKSEYNKLKFGDRGAPVVYCPLIIQLPGHVRELRERQAVNARGQSFFPAAASNTSNLRPVTALNDRQPIKDALSMRAPDEKTKRSSTPIPQFKLPSISLPSLFNYSRPTPAQSPPSSTSLKDALSLAISSPLHIELHLDPDPIPSLVKAVNVNVNITGTAQALKTSDTHPINVSQILPPELIPVISSHLSAVPSTGSSVPKRFRLSSPNFSLDRLLTEFEHQQAVNAGVPFSPAQAQIAALANGANPSRRTSGISFLPTPIRSSWRNSLPPLTTPKPEPAITLGNLYLSSCPGKKVRLNGPVRGRGAICRDLGRDLQRLKDLGVGCIVCCLDDDELGFLGSPWATYSAVASSMGLDILRIPTPEGLAPLSPEILNSHIDLLLEKYTLKGINILVHCRGGVGRAGVVACCWMMKLGLVYNEDIETIVRVVRKRRSLKAVETYEQVRFLVEFGEYLRNGSASPATNRLKSLVARA